jgi:hypothetical protein
VTHDEQVGIVQMQLGVNFMQIAKRDCETKTAARITTVGFCLKVTDVRVIDSHRYALDQKTLLYCPGFHLVPVN